MSREEIQVLRIKADGMQVAERTGLESLEKPLRQARSHRTVLCWTYSFFGFNQIG